MFGLKKHITIILIGIFIFPLTYQPWHMLRHHSQKTHSHHECRHSKVEEKDCSHGPGLNAASEKEEPCPICDYHFPINILPKLFAYHGKTAIVEYALSGLNARLPYKQVISVKSPRAPPTAS